MSLLSFSIVMERYPMRSWSQWQKACEISSVVIGASPSVASPALAGERRTSRWGWCTSLLRAPMAPRRRSAGDRRGRAAIQQLSVIRALNRLRLRLLART